MTPPLKHSRTYPATASALAFPLGGIGTGNVSLGARGELRDWEIFNSPAKGNSLPNTFFALWARLRPIIVDESKLPSATGRPADR